MNVSQYLEIFIEETKNHLQTINSNLLVIEKNPRNLSLINEVFRSIHTIKGMSGTMGFSNMAKFLHEVENLIQYICSKRIIIDLEVIEIIFKSIDIIETYLENIIENGTEGNVLYASVHQRIGNIISNADTERGLCEPCKNMQSNGKINIDGGIYLKNVEREALFDAVNRGLSILTIKVVLAKECLMKAARAFVVFQTVERYGSIIKSIPEVEYIEDERFEFEFSIVFVTGSEPEEIKSELNSIFEVDYVEIKRIDLEKDVLNTLTKSQLDKIKSINKAKDESIRKNLHLKRIGKTVRVDIQSLDKMMCMVGELTKVKREFENNISNEEKEKCRIQLNNMASIIRELDDSLRRIRMVSIGTIFDRFKNMIKDASGKLNKDIRLVISGEDTEIDRALIDEIGEPLIHLIRNCVDHGIETVSERKKNKKKPYGKILLRAYQKGNFIVIEVEDDGRGINVEQIKKKVIEKNIYNKKAAERLSEKQLLEFVFMPGFTLASEVTDLSGRGIGMDIVKLKIESLGGNVSLSTSKNKGTLFSIRLPLTLAVIQAFIISLGGKNYAIPASEVDEVIGVKKSDIKSSKDGEYIVHRDLMIPVEKLSDLLKISMKKNKLVKSYFAVVKRNNKVKGFQFDRLLEKKEIVIKPLSETFDGQEGISGATMLEDGSVVPIIDVNLIKV